MSQTIEKYLDRVMIFANRNETDAANIRAEQKDHLLKKVSDLQASGLSHQDATSQAIEQHGQPKNIGYSLRPSFPWLDVRKHGTARGFIAIGPKAKGFVAIGRIAIGVFAYGGIAFGLLSCGLLSLGLFAAIGILSLAPMGFAYGLAIGIGLWAFGIFSLGITAAGGYAISAIQYPFQNFDCIKAVSFYTSETAPAFLKCAKNFALNCTGPIFMPFWISAIFFLPIKLVLSRREMRRLKNEDMALIQ